MPRRPFFFLGFVLAVAILTACAGPQLAGEAAAAGRPGAAELAGEWRALRVNGAAVAADEGAPTLAFFEPGRAGGHAGCNRYSATVETARDGRLSFGPAMATKMACVDNARMQAEIDFLNALAAVRGYRHVGRNLQLLDQAGAVLIEFAPDSDANR